MEHYGIYNGAFKLSLWMRCWYAGNRGHGGIGGGGIAPSQILTDWQTGWSEMSDALRWDTDRLTRKLITWLTAVALRATGQSLIWYPTPTPAPPQPRLPWFSTFSLPLHLAGTFYLTVSLTATPSELCLFLELSVELMGLRRGRAKIWGGEMSKCQNEKN